MSAADTLIRAIEVKTGKNGKRVNKATRLLCPAHDDHHPSLDVSEGADGRAIVQCRSHGCTYEAIVAAAGLELGDLAVANGSPRVWTPAGDAVAVYDYVDEGGRLLYQVCRTADKQFLQRVPDPAAKSGYRWKLGDARRVLYRLPAVVETVAAGEYVYLAEGEKDVEALERAGVVATCNPMGAGKWSPDYTAALIGASVVIVADRDDAGLAHARSVSLALSEVGIENRVVLPAAGKDASDHLAAGLGVDDLVPHTDEEPDERFRIIVRTARQIAAIPDPPESDSLLGPLVTRGARTIVVGDTGHGKTTLTLQMGRAILSGDEMLGHAGIGDGPLLVVDLEQGLRSIKRSLHDARLDDRDDVLHVSIPDGIALESDVEHYAELERVLSETKPLVLILDPYYKAHRADANEERAITDLMRSLDALRVRHGFALILPAHPRKDVPGREGARKLTLHDVSGSGAVVRGAEIILAVERLNHGYARLRYLKDREGELPIGDSVNLLYDKEGGFRVDPKDEESDETLEARIVASEPGWKIAKEWASELHTRPGRAKDILDRLVASGRLAFAVGPAGRSAKAHCYNTDLGLLSNALVTDPETREPSGSVGNRKGTSATVPTDPPPVGGSVREPSSAPEQIPDPSEPEPPLVTDQEEDDGIPF